MNLKGVTSFVMIQGLALLMAFSARAQAGEDRWENISRSSKVSGDTKKLQQAARDVSAAIGLEDRSLMVQIYVQDKNQTAQEPSTLAEQLLQEVYWGPMSPNELKIQPLNGSNEDLETALNLIKSDLPNLSPRQSRALASALSQSYGAGAISRLAFEFSAEGGRCLGVLLISADQRQVVEIANCLTR